MNDFFHQIQKSWKTLSRDEKVPLILALTAVVFVFFPWASISFGMREFFHSYSVNGFRSFGMLTFWGGILFLLARLLPLFGKKVPDISISPKNRDQILTGAMSSGPILWILGDVSAFSYLGFGLFVSLISSLVLTYLVFTGKKFSEIFHQK